MLKLILVILLLAVLAAIGISVGGILKIAFGIIFSFIIGFFGGMGTIVFVADDDWRIRIIGLFMFVITLILIYLLVSYWIIGGWSELVSTVKEVI